MTDIRSYTPSQLMDDMEGREDADDYRVTIWSNAASHHVVILHTPTGIRGECGDHPGQFRNRREAWAQLRERLDAEQA